MVPHNSEFTRKLRAAVRAKIEEFGIDVDDELPDYVMIMVGNKKDKMRMKADLKLFLGDKTSDFVEWLFGFFQKVKNATAASATTAQQQLKQQGSAEAPTEKEKKWTSPEQIVDKGNGGVKALEKVSSMGEKATKERRERTTRKSENPSDSAKVISSSLSREEKQRQSHPKGRRLSSSAHHGTFRPPKSCSPSSRSRSPPRNDKGGDAKRTPPHRTRPSPVRKISFERKAVVLASKGPPALRSVVSVPVQFPPTAHPRVIARSPSPPLASQFLPPSPRLSSVGSSPKVLLSGGIVPMEGTPPLKIVNQLDIAVATYHNGGRRFREKKQSAGEKAGEVVPRKQQLVRTIRALSPLRKATLSENAPSPDRQPMDAAVPTKLSRRRVIFGAGSLIFQRAIQQQQQTTATNATTPQKTLPKATVVVRPQMRMVTVSSSPAGPPQHIEEGDLRTAIEATPTTKRPTQRRSFAAPAQHQQTGVSLFQRAIKETKRQRTEEGEEAEGMGTRAKRTSSELVEPKIQLEGTAEVNADAVERKRSRIEIEPQHNKQTENKEDEQAENEKKGETETSEEKQQQNHRDEPGEVEEEEVLTIDMSRNTRRKREIKRASKFGLELVKEHISGGQMAKDGRAKEEQKKGGEAEEQKHHSLPTITEHAEDGQKRTTVEADEKEDDGVGERGGRATPEGGTVHFKRNWTSNASALTTSAPIWDGRIEIDDMSSTDDEAEIDAVLEDAQRLRKLALERELPSTASMSRPLLYNPLDFSLSSESGLISPSDAALLPAVSYKQLVMLSGGGGFHPEQQPQQQLNGGTSVASSAAAIGVVTTATCDSTAADGAQQLPQQHQQRPHATVAPTTTIQTAPATMIVHQQYHYQSQQIRPFSHPYSQGYIPPSGHHTYRYQVNRGSVSKVYMGVNKTHFALQQQQQSVTMGGDKECQRQRLHLLRGQHTQKSQSLQRHLEEQRLLLGQLQKMATAKELEQRKELLDRARQIDAPIGQLRRELSEICEQITKTTKCDG